MTDFKYTSEFMCPFCDDYRIAWSDVWTLLAVAAIAQGLTVLHNGDFENARRNYHL